MLVWWLYERDGRESLSGRDSMREKDFTAWILNDEKYPNIIKCQL